MPASPAGFAYNDLAGVENYAHPGGLVVAGIHLLGDQRLKDVAAAGALVAGYYNFMESPSAWGSPEGDLLYGGRPAPDAYLWSPRRTNWSGTYMTDVRTASSWGQRAVAYIAGFAARHPHIKRLFLDVYGERLWTSSWTAMTSAEKTAWAAGMRYWLPKIRAACAPFGIKLIVNGTWAQGNRDAHGATVENHGWSEVAYWTEYLGDGRWADDEHIVITRVSADVQRWANVPNVRWVAFDQSNYARVGPVWGPFNPDAEPDPEVPPVLQVPVPPSWGVSALADGRLRLDVTPLPGEVGADAYQLYGTGQNDEGKIYRSVPAGVTFLELPVGIEYTLRMSAHNKSPNNGGYGPWAPEAGVRITPRIAAPPPPDLPSEVDQLEAENAALRADLAGARAARDSATAEAGALREDLVAARADLAAIRSGVAGEVLRHTNAIAAVLAEG